VDTVLVDTVLVDKVLVEPELVDPELVDQEHVNRKLSAYPDNVSWLVPSHLPKVSKYPEFKKVCRL
jgi:hypothetical protein